MTRFPIALSIAALLATSALAQPANPFAQASTLPYQAPPFDRIKDSDYQPAIEQGQRQALAEVRAIADNPAPPSFDNVIVALEKKGQMLSRAEVAFGAVTQANTNPTLQAAQAALAPQQAAYTDAIYLDAKLFARVKALHDRQAALHLDPEQAMLLETYWNNFVHAGAQLSVDRPGDLARAQQATRHALQHLQGEAARRHQGGGAGGGRQGKARRPLGCGPRRRAADRHRARHARQICPAAPEHDHPARARLADRSCHAQGAVRPELDPRREGRRRRHARYGRADRAAPRAEGQAARLPDLGRLYVDRADGEDLHGRDRLHERARCRHPPRAGQRGEGDPGGDRRRRQGCRGELPRPALGLGPLCRAGPQGEVRSR